MSEHPEVPSVDGNARNADWTKRSWDIPADNVEELRKWLRGYAISVEEFKALPVYLLNVDRMPWLKDL